MNRRWLSGLVLAALALTAGVSAPAGRQGQERYAPQEWQSMTVTRYVRSVAVGSRFVGVATEGGLLFYDRLVDRWNAPMTRSDGLPDNAVQEVRIRADGNFEIRTRRDVGVVDPLAMRYMPDPFGVVRPPAPPIGLPGNLFAGPDYLYLPGGQIAGPSGFTADIVASDRDEDAGIWIGTWGLGAGHADLRTLSLQMKPQGLWLSEVQALLVTPGVIVAGGLGGMEGGGGISELDRRASLWRYTLAADTPGLLSDRVSDLTARGREVWAAVQGAVARRDAGGRWQTWTRAHGLPDGRTTAVAAGDGEVWVGTMRGAAAVVGDTLVQVPLAVDRAVLGISVSADGVWWATEAGAYSYRGAWPEGQMARMDHPDGRLDGQVDAVGSHENEVWWGGAMGVVGYHAGRGEWLDVPRVGPFVPGEVNDIALDDENVWVGTATGVWRLIRETGQWHHYTEADGLIGGWVWTIELEPEAHVVWFGTDEGLTRFDYRLRRKAP